MKTVETEESVWGYEPEEAAEAMALISYMHLKAAVRSIVLRALTFSGTALIYLFSLIVHFSHWAPRQIANMNHSVPYKKQHLNPAAKIRQKYSWAEVVEAAGDNTCKCLLFKATGQSVSYANVSVCRKDNQSDLLRRAIKPQVCSSYKKALLNNLFFAHFVKQ